MNKPLLMRGDDKTIRVKASLEQQNRRKLEASLGANTAERDLRMTMTDSQLAVTQILREDDE